MAFGRINPVQLAHRNQFRQAGFLAVFAAVSAVLFLFGDAAAQTKNSDEARDLDVRAMQAGNAELLLHVRIVEHKSKNLKLPTTFEDVAVGSPDIADVVPVSDQQLYIVGKKIGTTNVLIYGAKKKLVGIIDVEVTPDTAWLNNKIREASGGKDIHVEDVDGKIVIQGATGDPVTAQRAMEVAKGLGKEVVNAMKVTTPQQVMLKVRFVEADREQARNLGIRWAFFKKYGNAAGVVGTQQSTNLFANPNFPASTSLGGVTTSTSTATATTTTTTPLSVFDVVGGAMGAGSPFATIITQIVNNRFGSLDMVLSALEEQNVIRQLAQPNLIALSGQSASFLAGGAIPVPVVSAASSGTLPTVTIQYQQFGVQLNFTPTVLARGVISLTMNPEVSSLDFANAVTIAGTTIPALTIRQAQTTVELRDGQTFAIAGMLQSVTQRQLEQLPWLGSLPVVGALFRSTQFQQNETELVVLVTPYLVKPVPPGKELKTPLDNSLPGNDLDLFLNGRPEIAKTPPGFFDRSGQDQSLSGAIQQGAPTAQPVAPAAVAAAPVPQPIALAPAPAPVSQPVALAPAPAPEPKPQGNGAQHWDPVWGYVNDSGKGGGQ
jgi:pilus assembly protein CpaC